MVPAGRKLGKVRELGTGLQGLEVRGWGHVSEVRL